MGDHTESLQIDFDPAQIDFKKVAEVFWSLHHPCAAVYSQQYRSAIWFHSEEQQEVLINTKAQTQLNYGHEVTTPLLRFDKFYLAEDHHQKYRLQANSRLMKYFQTVYSKFEDFNNSTAAARLNGFISGSGSKELLEQEAGMYGVKWEP